MLSTNEIPIYKKGGKDYEPIFSKSMIVWLKFKLTF